MTDLTITEAAAKLLLTGKLKADNVETDGSEAVGDVHIDAIRININGNELCRVMFMQEDRVILEAHAKNQGQIATVELDCRIPVDTATMTAEASE